MRRAAQRGDGEWLIALAMSLALHILVFTVLGVCHLTGENASDASSQQESSACESEAQEPSSQTQHPSEKVPSENLARASENKRTRAPSKPTRPSKNEKEPAQSDDIIYQVGRGEGLYKIAEKCQCDPRELAKLNGLTLKSELKLGQKIKLPKGAQVPES